MTTITLDRAGVMRLAWIWAKQDQWSRRDFAPGALRRYFADALRRAWVDIRRRIEHRAAAIAARATARPLDVIRAERDMLQNKSRWSQADYARDSELRQEEYIWYVE